MRDFLVFVRAGVHSLHRKWLEEDSQRNWDCCVSWYCPPIAESGAEYYVNDGDNKIEAFDIFFEQTHKKLLYKYYLVVDDDLAFVGGDISKFFNICTQYNCYLTQPSLNWGTYSTFDVTLHNPVCIVRKSKFVEVMAPCFSFQAVEELKSTFRLTRSTWGIDYAWASILKGRGLITIIDPIRITHTKAIDLIEGAFYRKLRSQGVDAGEELNEIRKRFPPFGPFRIERYGHIVVYRYLPQFLAPIMVRIMESVKKRIHRRIQRNRKLSEQRG